jgi:hypothetical protein
VVGNRRRGPYFRGFLAARFFVVRFFAALFLLFRLQAQYIRIAGVQVREERSGVLEKALRYLDILLEDGAVGNEE